MELLLLERLWRNKIFEALTVEDSTLNEIYNYFPSDTKEEYNPRRERLELTGSSFSANPQKSLLS
jgi:hypothetical protein